MRILAVVGSPRKGGNTDALVDKVIEGARSSGATVEKIYLSDLDIGACDVCNSCSGNGRCVKDDGMQQVYTKMLWAGAWGPWVGARHARRQYSLSLRLELWRYGLV